MDQRERLLQLVTLKGPVLPAHINQDMETSVLFASAMLSELVDSKKLKLSHMKIGGSPLYYAPGQENRLQEFEDKISTKFKEAYDRLKEHKLLEEIQQEPVIRAALKEIKDFAVPIDVVLGGETKRFWKWYLLSDTEVDDILRNIFDPPKPDYEMETVHEQHIEIQSKPVKSLVKKERKTVKKVRSKRVKKKQPKIPEKVSEKVKKEEVKQEEKVEDSKPQKQVEKVAEAEKKIEKAIEIPVKEKEEQTSQEEIRREKKQVEKQEEKEQTQDSQEQSRSLAHFSTEDDAFWKQIQEYFTEQNILVKEYSILRKESDIEGTIIIPSAVGRLHFFCKAKNKKRVNDGDLSSAYIQAQSKKLPILFITTGEVTKKAKDMMEREFSSMKLKQLK
jgi:hypothetical protein